ncbi:MULTISPECIES: fatty acid desaturase [unclassified Caballeronia]|uniref:fatty acid desaturase family protein n=1 Tax=unclassified Caballeronia TaxID=2646786 RepID=UPI0028598B43|nr:MULTISPECIES: fatty acid desaturase [unclassified Caballeronia]MDR5738458.1 fatty acid desaturase [Caballeronia sp. LZ016]MDR5811687.1 fatty acid desaturase [Caballeronia sp. LZ019]
MSISACSRSESLVKRGKRRVAGDNSAATPNAAMQRPDWLRAVEWKDLVPLTRMQSLRELSIPLPWLLASWFAAYRGWIVVALGLSFMFFLTGARQVHDAYHGALGVSRRATDLLMFVMSVLLLGAMHSVKYNHLRHHAKSLGPDDLEAASAYMPWWQAISMGPLFPLCLYRNAIRKADQRTRAWIIAETVANVAWIALVFGVFDCAFLKYHVIAMAMGQCLTSFFAVWAVHHDADDALARSRTVRGKLRSLVSYNIFMHMEHHLFPRVPTCNLPRLAARIDAASKGSPLKMVI